MSRPLPTPPRCRGIPLGDGNFTGCLCGYGDVAPFAGVNDCPTCEGSGFELPIVTTLPHASFGAPGCPGCLSGILQGQEIAMACNECGAVVRSAPPGELMRMLDEMESAIGVAAEMCPHCRAVNLFPGFSSMTAYVCQKCGKGVSVGGGDV